jgi:hypothetical protein
MLLVKVFVLELIQNPLVSDMCLQQGFLELYGAINPEKQSTFR